MTGHRIPKPYSRSPLPQEKTSPFAPRPFAQPKRAQAKAIPIIPGQKQDQLHAPQLAARGEQKNEDASIQNSTTTSRTTANVVQRLVGVDVDGIRHWYSEPDDLREAAFEQAGATALSIENLARQTNDGVTHRYASWQDAFAATEVTADPLALMAVPLGPQSLEEIRVGGSNPENENLKFMMVKEVVDKVTEQLDGNPGTKGNYMLGGSYAAALRGTSRPPGDVDIDFLTDDSYKEGRSIITGMPGAQERKSDDSIGRVEFIQMFQRTKQSRSIPITITIEFVNLNKKAINQNVKKEMATEFSTIHKGVQVPRISAMIINWMDRYIESESSKVKVEQEKSTIKGDLQNIREIRRQHEIEYETVRLYMVREKKAYRRIWELSKPK